MKGRIDIHNYEAFLLDYAEGNLDAATVRELKAFAIANPQLGIDLDNAELPYLNAENIHLDIKPTLKKSGEPGEAFVNYLENSLPEAEKIAFEKRLAKDEALKKELEQYRKAFLKADLNISFENKAELLRSEDDLAMNNRALAYLEGQLSEKEKALFENDLRSDMSLAAELKLFKKTVLVSDNSIVFPDKRSLKKEGRVVAMFSFRAVASIAAVILLLAGLFGVILYDGSGVTINAKPAVAAKTIRRGNTTVVTKVKKSVGPLNISKSDPVASVNPKHTTKQNVVVPVISSQVVSSGTGSVVSNSLAVNNSTSQNAVNNSTVQNEPVITNNTIVATTASVAATSTVGQAHSVPVKAGNSNVEGFSPVSQLAVVSDDDDDEKIKEEKKPGFWERAVKVARRANSLGVKAVDGEEGENRSFLISFNAFSVEKK